jgi:hypothetical protein
LILFAIRSAIMASQPPSDPTQTPTDDPVPTPVDPPVPSPTDPTAPDAEPSEPPPGTDPLHEGP